MYVRIIDTKNNNEFKFFVADAPEEFKLLEETQKSRARFRYYISEEEIDGAQLIYFREFASVLFFDFAFEGNISKELRNWIESL